MVGRSRFGGLYAALSSREAVFLQEFIRRSVSPGDFSELDLDNTSISDLIVELEDEVNFMSEILSGGSETPGEMPWDSYGFDDEEEYLQYRRDIGQVGYIIRKLKSYQKRFLKEVDNGR